MSSKKRILIASISLAISVFSVLWFPIAAFGVKYGVWGIGTGLVEMTIKGSPIIIGFASVVAAGALIVSLTGAPRKLPLFISVLAALVTGVTAYSFASKRAQSARMPPIHDVQTNWGDPIKPSTALLAARKRAQASNTIESAPKIPEAAAQRWPGMGGKSVSQAQEDAECASSARVCPKAQPYPELTTLISNASSDTVMPIALDIFNRNGWKIITYNLQFGQLEGTATTAWFGFEDDVMVRVQASDRSGSTLIDVRSTSRIGFSDHGANAKRISRFLSSLDKELNASD